MVNCVKHFNINMGKWERTSDISEFMLVALDHVVANICHSRIFQD